MLWFERQNHGAGTASHSPSSPETVAEGVAERRGVWRDDNESYLLRDHHSEKYKGNERTMGKIQSRAPSNSEHQLARHPHRGWQA